jgi:hypothetical protein
MPRQPSRCSYCRDLDHNISKCSKYDLELVLNIYGRSHSCYYTNIKRNTCNWVKIDLKLLSQLKLLTTGLIPVIVRPQYTGQNKTSLCVIRYENDRIYKEEWKIIDNAANSYIETIAAASLNSYPNTIQNYLNDYKSRLTYYKRGCRCPVWEKFDTVISILYGDYVEITSQVGAIQRARAAAYEEWRLERRNQENVVNSRVNTHTNREILPIIRDNAIEANDCPICLEDLGETSKSVLRCGHQLCMSCLIGLTLRSTDLSLCKCPVCRVSYI